MVNEIGNQITEALERLGKTQSWLAEAVGVSDTAVSKWINEGTISRANAGKVAKALGISVDHLLHGPEDSVWELLAEPLKKLPVESQQDVLEYMRFKFERARSVIASDNIASYLTMIDRIKADMERLKKGDK
jgi:transcriptional regulator with XRE-family HTH domain